MSTRNWIRGRMLDWAMGQMDELRAETLAPTQGDVLEVGFGTGLNLDFYPPTVKSVTALDPQRVEGLPALEKRLEYAPFPVERCDLRADSTLPFDSDRFDCVVSTWTLCSIPEPVQALREMLRTLKPGGIYVFIEHGRAPSERTARWQNRLDPFWCRFADGCHMNRVIDRLVQDSGFRIARIDRFRHKGPGLLAHMYRGVATDSA